MKIFKYPIDRVNEWFTLNLPANFRPLTFQFQQRTLGDIGSIFMWAIVDACQGARKYEFIAIGTGIEFNAEGAKYIGTAIDPNEGFVWHLFYKGEK